MKYFSVLKLVSFLLLLSCSNLYAADLLVPSQYSTIQAAIDAANSGDTVLVAPGTYNEKLIFNASQITVRSLQGPEVTIIDAQQTGNVVIFPIGSNAVLSGFTITGGRRFQGGSGIAIIISGSSPTIENNIITGNAAIVGTTIQIINGNPIVRDNLIENNIDCCGSGGGGGIILVTDSIPGDGNAVISNNIIQNNKTTFAGNGGAIHIFSGSPLIEKNIIRNNITQGDGAGISIFNGSSTIIRDNLIYSNTANQKGGGILNLSNASPKIINNTIFGNIAAEGSQVYSFTFNDRTTMANNIIFGASNASSVFCEDFNLQNLTIPSFINNNVFNSVGLSVGGVCNYTVGIDGNISVDPQFLNTSESKLALKAGSPSIDAGSNNESNISAEDILGNARIVDGDNDGITIVDQGAYESNPAGIIALKNRAFVVNENSSSVLVSVCRAGGTSGEVSIDYSTVDSTALDGVNYVLTSGTILFSDGEGGCKEVSIPIIDNSILNDDLSFSFSLTNPSGGAVLDIDAASEIFIQNDDVDLSITKSADYVNYLIGNTITYTIDVSNMHDTFARGVVVTDILPGEVSFVSSNPSQGVCSGTTTVTCDIGDISAGGSASIAIVATANVVGDVLNSASVSVNGSDVNSSNDNDSVSITVNNLPTAVELFPLVPGVTFNYLANSSFQETETVLPMSVFNGVQTFGIRDNEGDIEYFTNDANGLLDYGSFSTSENLTSRATPPLRFLETQPSLGQVINQTGTLTFSDPTVGTFPLSYTYSSTVQELESITVPFGTFDALKVDLSLQVSGFINGQLVNINQMSSTWLAPGIGEIRSITTTDGLTKTRELVSLNNPPAITSPTDGSTFTSASQTFSWDAMGTPVTEWWINLGSTLGGRDLHVSGSLGSATSTTINNIPVDGSTIYARLWYRNGGGAWQSQDFSYTAFTGPPPQLPTVTSPTDGSTFTSASQTFSWDAMGTPVTEWWINLGSTLGGRDLHVSGSLGSATSTTINNIPVDGSTIYARLWYRNGGGAWQSQDFSYTAFTGPPPQLPTVTSPTDGSTFTSASQTFSWDAMGTPVTEWWINLGSTLGGRDLHVSGSLGSATSTTINNIPVDGSTIYARLWYRNGGGAWQSQDFSYTAFTGPPPQLPTVTSPTDGSTFTSASQTFSWDAMGTPVTEWWINLGSTLGGRDLHVSGSLGSATSTTINNIPVDGSTIYARLWYRNGGGAWQSQDFSYTAFTGPPPQLPTVTSPTDGSTFTSASQTFSWDAMGTPVTEWWINLGSTLGGRDLHVSGSLGSATSTTINNIPVDGSTIYARLWYRNGGGAWQSQDFSYTTAILFVGQFNVSGSQTDTGCQDPDDNGTSSYTGVFSITNQVNNSFSGNLTFLTVDGISLAGTGVSANGLFNADSIQQTNASGDYALNAMQGSTLIARNEGMFTGSISGNLISINYTGMDTLGDICQATGSFSGER